jgi:hypothetical protein
MLITALTWTGRSWSGLPRQQDGREAFLGSVELSQDSLPGWAFRAESRWLAAALAGCCRC